MNIFKTVVLSIALLLALTGCGEGGTGGPVSENDSNIRTVSVSPSANLITSKSQNFIIDVRVVDDNGDLHNGGEVTVKYPDDFSKGRDVGSFASIVSSVVDGVARFSYTSPENISQNSSDILFSFYHKDKPKLLTTYTLSIGTATPTTLSIVLPKEKIVVTQDQEIIAVRVNVSDSHNSPYQTGKVTVDYPSDANSRDVGRFTSRSADVVNGVAIFNYTAPDDLSSNTDNIKFTFYHEDNAGVKKELTVELKPSVEIVSVVNNIAVVPSLDKVTSNKQVFEVEVRLSDQNGDIFTSGNVGVKYPSNFINGTRKDVGEFASALVLVGSNGIAHFDYTAPSDIAANTSDIVFTFYHESKPEIKKTYTLNIDTTLTTLSIVLPKNKIVVTQDQESVEVRVNVMDANNNPYQTGKVVVNYPSDASSRDVGRFTSRSADVDNGVAIFNYNAPDDLSSNTGDIKFTFYHEDNADVKKELSVKIDLEMPDLTILLPKDELTILQNTQEKSVEVKVYKEDNTPYDGGNVKIIYPDSIKNGRDVGLFTESTVSLKNGVASFEYTGPGNIDTDTSDIIFKFYHEDNPTKKANLTVKIDNSQTIINIYHLDVEYKDSSEMNLGSLKEITLSVKDADGNLLNGSNINSIAVDTSNSNLGTLKDTSGNKGASLTFTGENEVIFYVESNSTSGTLPIKVDVNLTDLNDDNQTLEQVINVTILSGPPTAMSLAYISTSKVPDMPKFTERWVLTVTDKYSNKISTEPSVSMGLIAGFIKKSGGHAPTNNQHYMYYESGGKLDASKDTFTAPIDVNFTDMDSTNDKFVTFGKGYTYDASGKFEVADVDQANNNKINLQNDYTGSDADDLGFAIGNNHREDSCNVGVEWVATVSPEDGYIINKDTGTMILNITYDYYLVGKSVVLYVNMIGNDSPGEKIGEARKLTLRGEGLEAVPISYSNGAKGNHMIMIKIKGTNEYYRNANFGGYSVSAPDELEWEIDDTSMSNNNVSSCINSGVAYVNVNIKSEATKGGTITLENVLPSREF